MSFNPNDFFPYNKMKEVEIDGQKMVQIPRIYVKNVVLDSGPYKGKPAYFMSETKGNGYHVHPAFMNGGVPASALALSCYEASHDSKDSSKAASIATSNFWQNINRNDAIQACLRRNVSGGTEEQKGWHCWDIYCQHLLARIMTFEYGTTGFVFPEDGSPDYVYRGIHQPAGNPQSPTWLPGIGNIGDTIYLADSNGSGAMINTGLKCAGNGWPTAFAMNKGANFDFGDVFIASAVSGTESSGTCSDYQRLARNGVNETGYITGYRGSYTQDPTNSHGMFGITQETYYGNSGYGSPSAVWAGHTGNSNYSGPLRFRLAKFVS